MASSSQEGNTTDFTVVETDPTGQYIRYKKIIGTGGRKTVYKGFDKVNATEIAWSKTEITKKMTKSTVSINSLYAEGDLLKSLEHENILKCYKSWEERAGNITIVHMITELFTCGNLIKYIRNHNFTANNMVIKNWARQILQALHYLHSHDPPIIHRDVKGENILVDGNTGRVKLADFDKSMSLVKGTSIEGYAGTPEFMAPELYSYEYDQLVDIYSFGICIVQMVTRERPYWECDDRDEIKTKVIAGVMPTSLSKVTDPEIMRFIQRCLIRDPSVRPTAMSLLNDPFLALSGSGTNESSMELVKEIDNDYGDKYKLKGTKKGNVLSMNLRILPKEKQIDVEILETDMFAEILEKVTEFELSPEDATRVLMLMDQLIKELKAGPSNPSNLRLPSSSRSQHDQDKDLEQHGESSEDKEKTQPSCFGKFNPCRKSVKGFSMSSAEDVTPVSELTEQVSAELKARPSSSRGQQNQDRELEQHEDSEDEGRGSRRSQPSCFGKFNPCRKSVKGFSMSSAEDVTPVSELTEQVSAELKARPSSSRGQQNQDRELEQHEDSEDEGRGSRRSQPSCFGKFNPCRKSVKGFSLSSSEDATPVSELTEQVSAELKARPSSSRSQQNQDRELEQHEDSEDEGRGSRRSQPSCFGNLSIKGFNHHRKS